MKTTITKFFGKVLPLLVMILFCSFFSKAQDSVIIQNSIGEYVDVSVNSPLASHKVVIGNIPTIPIATGFTGKNKYATFGVPSYYYVRTVEPWGQNTNLSLLDQAWGSGTYTVSDYTIAASVLFSTTTKAVFLEGSCTSNPGSLSTYLANNLTVIQNWVSAGGRLFINAAPNEGGSFNLGFSGNTLNFSTNFSSFISPSGSIVSGQSTHPIFNGPFTPIGTSWSGYYFSHATVSGNNATPLITGANGNVLSVLKYGNGIVLFGGMTIPYFHSPQPNANNLRANIFYYLKNVVLATPAVIASFSPTSAATGTSVTISGSGFTGASAVSFGGTAASSFTVTNDNTIVAVVGAGTTGLISITTTGGTTTTAGFNYCTNVTPAVSIAASASTICVGTSVTFTATPTNGGTAPTYQWKKNSVNVGTGGTSYSDAGLKNNDAITCVMTANNTCQTSNTATSNSTTVTVNALPVVAPISGLASGLCVGSSTTLTDATPAGVWSTTTPNISSISSKGLLAGLVVGTSSVTYTVTDGNGCVNFVTSSGSINALPTVAPIVGTVTGLCLGSTTTLTDATPNGVWSTTTPNIGSISKTGVVTGLAAGTGSVTYTVTDANGCVNSVTSSGPVYALPIPTITGGSYGCGNISYTANGGVSYLWNTGATPTTAANIFNTATSYTATVVATDVNGCQASASQVIPANTAPTITSVAAQNTLVETAVAPTVTVGDLEIPNSLTVTATSSNTKLVPNTNIVVTGTGATRTINVTPAQDQIGTASITVIVTDCGGLSTSTSFNVNVTVPNYPSGTAGFVIRKTTSLIDNCSDSIYIVNRSYNGPGAIYQWYINGYYTTKASFLNSSDGLISYKTPFPGTYTALLVVTDPVNGKTYEASQTFTFTRGIVPVPSPAFEVHSVVPNGSGTATVTLNSLTPSVQDGLINAWTITPLTNVASFDATSNTPTLSIKQTTVAQTLSASLTVSPVNGCSSYSTPVKTITVPAYAPIVANFTTGITKSKVDPCSDSVYIINTTTGGVGGNTYSWFLGDNSPAIVTTSTATIGKMYIHPNTYSILLNVTDATGQTASKQMNFTTNGTIPPVYAVAEIYGPVNTTNTATVTIEGGNSNTAYGTLNYSWIVTPTGGTATTYNNVNQQLTINRLATSQTYTATLTVKDALTGCKTNSNTQTFTVDKLEAIPPTATPITANFTVGITKSKVDPCTDSVYINNTTTGGTGGNTYTWYLGDNSSAIVTTSTATIGKIYTHPNTYNIVLDVADHAGQYASKQLTVTTNGTTPPVTAVPIVYGPYNSTATSNVLLEGGNSTIAYGSLNYAWTITPAVGTVSSSTSVNVPLTITRKTADQTYTAVLTVSDALGCKTNAVTKTFTVSKLDPVVPAPTPITANFTIGTTKSKVDPCSDSIYFTNTTTGGAGGLVYTWYLGDNTSSPYITTSTATFGKIYIHPNTYTVLLVVNDNAGQYSSKQLNVTTVGTIPPVMAIPLVYGPSLNPTTATVTLDGGTSITAYGNLNYAWTVTPTGAAATNYTSASVPLTINRTNADQVYNAKLTVTDALTGCKTNTATQTFTIKKLDAINVPIVLNANFTVAVTKSKVDPCTDSVTITNTTTGGVGNNSYTWYLNDGTNISTTNSNAIGHIYTAAGTYNVQLDVTDKEGTFANKTIPVTVGGVIPAVNAVVIIYGPYTSSTSSTITLDGGNSGAGLVYQWVVTVGGVSTTYNTANPVLTITRTNADQLYSAVLTVTDATGCRKSVSATQTFTIPRLGAPGFAGRMMSEKVKANSIVAYPNPATSFVNLKLSLVNAEGGELTVQVYNIIGKQVTVKKWAITNSNQANYTLPISNLTAGNYHVVVLNSKGEKIATTTITK